MYVPLSFRYKRDLVVSSIAFFHSILYYTSASSIIDYTYMHAFNGSHRPTANAYRARSVQFFAEGIRVMCFVLYFFHGEIKLTTSVRMLKSFGTPKLALPRAYVS